MLGACPQAPSDFSLRTSESFSEVGSALEGLLGALDGLLAAKGAALFFVLLGVGRGVRTAAPVREVL